MEISARPLRQYPLDPNYPHDDYEVLIDGHKILTVETHGANTVSRWLFDSVRRPNTRSDGYVVSLAVEREYVTYNKRGLADTPYDLLELCIGSHCLIFHIPDPKDNYRSYSSFDPTFLRKFFKHRSVTVVGRGMKAVAEKLDRDFGIKILRWFDLNELAVKAMRREDLDLARYDLDRLAKVVLGKRWDVVRDDEPVDWYRDSRQDFYYDLPLSVDKVMFATVDTYLCFMIGTRLLEMIRSPPPPDLASSSKKKKKSDKKKKL